MPSLEKCLAGKRGVLVSLHGARDMPCSGVLGMSGLSVSQERRCLQGRLGKSMTRRLRTSPGFPFLGV